MRIQLLSDLHAEGPKNKTEEFIENLDPSISDALVLAGDIASSSHIVKFLRLFCQKYEGKPIIYVAGNHEYYGAPHKQAVEERIARIHDEHPNFRYLDQGTAEIDGRTFRGCTLWYPDPGRYTWSDYRHINLFGLWSQQEAAKHSGWLRGAVGCGDIVVTHMLPSPLCVHSNYQYDDNNVFFIHDMTDLIEEASPELWLFGHTHHHMDLKIGSTRLACNPRGHAHETGTNGFDPNFIIEV